MVWEMMSELACPDCATAVAARRAFLEPAEYLPGALLPFVAVGAAVAAASVLTARRRESGRVAPVVKSGLLLGAGLGGFVDGIVLHQLLQWHNMLSSVVPPTDLVAMKLNMLWDGMFHALMWLMTAAGVWQLWRAGGRTDTLWSSRAFVGALLLGWGLFNAIEGVVDHQILGIHHVRPGSGELAWDLGFIASGLLLCASGAALIRQSIKAA